MSTLYDKLLLFLEKRLDFQSRLILLLGALILVLAVFLPLWSVQLDAQQFPEGLEVKIYSYTLKGGGERGNDLNEINILNHYIGMQPLKEEDFDELKWIPLILGFFVVFTLRTAAIGKVSSILDILVLFLYFGIFSLGNFYYKLYVYGHNLDPGAAITVEPYTPPLLGSMQIANFTVTSLPSVGGILLFVFTLVLTICLIINYFAYKREKIS